MTGYNLSGSVFNRPKSTMATVPLLLFTSPSSFFFPLSFLALNSLSTLSTSSSAFLKSFVPAFSCPRSSMSSRARRRRRRSRSLSPKSRIGCPLARSRRMASLFGILNVLSKVAESESRLSGTGVLEMERDEVAYSPAQTSMNLG